MTLNQGKYLLVEFDFDEEPEFVNDLIEEIHKTKVIPVIAHAERYEFVQRDPNLVYSWRKKDIQFRLIKEALPEVLGSMQRKRRFF